MYYGYKPGHLRVTEKNIASGHRTSHLRSPCWKSLIAILFNLSVTSTYYLNLDSGDTHCSLTFKLPLWLKEKNQFLFVFIFWKRVWLTPDWQNFELWFLSKGNVLWVQDLDFMVRHYSCSKLIDWTSDGWIQGNTWRQRLTILKAQRVNVAYYICKTRLSRSESPKPSWYILIMRRTHALHS